MYAQLVDALGDLPRPHVSRIGHPADLLDLGEFEMRLRDHVADRFRQVGNACEIEKLLSLFGEHLGPLAGFKRNAVGAAKAGGDKTDPVGREGMSFGHCDSFR